MHQCKHSNLNKISFTHTPPSIPLLKNLHLVQYAKTMPNCNILPSPTYSYGTPIGIYQSPVESTEVWWIFVQNWSESSGVHQSPTDSTGLPWESIGLWWTLMDTIFYITYFIFSCMNKIFIIYQEMTKKKKKCMYDCSYTRSGYYIFIMYQKKSRNACTIAHTRVSGDKK